MAEPQPLASHEIADAVANLDFFAVRAKGIIALACKLREVQSLIGAEQEKRRTLSDLDEQAAAVRAVVATAAAAQTRLDNIQAELEQHRVAAEAEAKRITDAAHSAAHDIVEAAHTKAEGILAAARDEAAVEAERQAGAARQRQDEIARLDADIAARRAERDGINDAIAAVRARLGVA
jgi:cell division septum initiation protein DivIVA